MFGCILSGINIKEKKLWLEFQALIREEVRAT